METTSSSTALTRLFCAHPDLPAYKVPALRDAVHEAGGILIQAHPFRNGRRIVDPALLDGIEIFNGGVSNENRNDIAAIWAEHFGLIGTAGSDYHLVGGYNCLTGIFTDTPIRTGADLVHHLRADSFTVAEPLPPPEQTCHARRHKMYKAPEGLPLKRQAPRALFIAYCKYCATYSSRQSPSV